MDECGVMALKKKTGSSARGTRPVKSEKGIKPKKINYSDIPELSDQQLSAMRRVGRSTVGDEPRKLVALHLDAKVLRWLRKAAEKRAALSIARQRDNWPAR